MKTSSSKTVIRPEGTARVRPFLPEAAIQAAAEWREQPQIQQEGAWKTVFESEPDDEALDYQESTGMIAKAKQEAALIMARASENAEKLLSDARKQAEAMKTESAKQGYQEGYEQGSTEGKEQAERELREILNRQSDQFQSELSEALTAIGRAKEKALSSYLNELKDCSLAVAEKVIHISLKSSGEVIKRMILAETEKLPKLAWVKIYMDKTDYEAVIQTDADLLSELSRLSDNIKFIVMEREKSGSCIIEMPDEIVDISVDTQLENIKEILGTVHV